MTDITREEGVDEALPPALVPAQQPRAPYLEAVVAYASRGSTRFHVPGHKGGAGADPGLIAALGSELVRLGLLPA